MNNKIIIILFVGLFSVIPLTFAQSAPDAPDPSKSHNIVGAGATFPYPLIDLWRVEYNAEFPNINLNYQSIGSGGGIKQHIEKTVNFAASDAPMRVSEKQLAVGTLHIPETIGGIVIAYNIPEIPNKGMKLTGENIADIYLGKIKKWNNDNIAQNNPELDLPDKEIIPARRSDGSGTTFVFTDYLTSTSPEFDKVVGKGKSVPWPTGVGAAGNEGVAGIIHSTPYSIGYVELAYAFQTDMTFAFIENGDGTSFIEPTINSISAASSIVADKLPAPKDDWNKVTLVNAQGPESYPISSFTYLLVYDELSQVTTSKEQAQAIIHMIHWMLTDGQEYSTSLQYVPLSDKVVQLGKTALAQIKYEDQIIWNDRIIPSWLKDNSREWSNGADDLEFINVINYMVSEKILDLQNPNVQSIPKWVKHNAGWWAENLINDEQFISATQYLLDEKIISN